MRINVLPHYHENKSTFITLHVDNFLLTCPDIGLYKENKLFLFQNFDMKNLVGTSFVLGTTINRDKSRDIWVYRRKPSWIICWTSLIWKKLFWWSLYKKVIDLTRINIWRILLKSWSIIYVFIKEFDVRLSILYIDRAFA